MRASFIHIAAAITAFALMACSDSADSPSLLAPSATPTAIKIPLPPGALVDIGAGSEHTCARTSGGTLYCWGSNSNGQIGVPTTATCGLYGFGLTACVPRPAVVTGQLLGKRDIVLKSFTTVNRFSVGSFHTCAVSAGTAWCWGSNMFGQIGTGSSTPTNVIAPAVVAGGLSFTGIGAGGGASCGTSNTLLYCWGTIRIGAPTGLSPSLFSWQSGWSDNINIGSRNACAMNNSAQWSCWGDNLQGQLGADPAVWQYFDGPLGNPAFQGAWNVSPGSGFTCIDRPDTTIQCLGDNSSGQLGDFTFIGLKTYTPLTVGGPSARSLSRVTTGYAHACALDPQGAAWCWGDDRFGQLGRGTGAPIFPFNIVRDPVAVAGGHTFIKLAAGHNHTCGLTIARTIFCWGDNYFSQLGVLNQAAPVANPQPVQVMF